MMRLTSVQNPVLNQVFVTMVTMAYRSNMHFLPSKGYRLLVYYCSVLLAMSLKTASVLLLRAPCRVSKDC